MKPTESKEKDPITETILAHSEPDSPWDTVAMKRNSPMEDFWLAKADIAVLNIVFESNHPLDRDNLFEIGQMIRFAHERLNRFERRVKAEMRLMVN